MLANARQHKLSTRSLPPRRASPRLPEHRVHQPDVDRCRAFTPGGINGVEECRQYPTIGQQHRLWAVRRFVHVPSKQVVAVRPVPGLAVVMADHRFDAVIDAPVQLTDPRGVRFGPACA